MDQGLRTFIAIELPLEIQHNLGRFMDLIKDKDDRITWVSPEKIHLTLKFLGNVPHGEIESITKIISLTVKDYPEFPASIKGTGFFPNEKQPRVVWVGMDKGREEVKKIFLNLEEGLSQIGISKEDRGFAAHMTLGRIKYIKDKDKFTQNVYSHKEDLFGNFNIDSISLIKSTLTQKGSVYETICKAQLSPL